MEYVLKIVSDDNCKFNGDVILNIHQMSERCEIMNKLALDGNDLKSEIGDALTIVKIVEPRILKVNLTHTSGEVVDSVEKFLCCSDALFTINKMAATVIYGISLGNASVGK